MRFTSVLERIEQEVEHLKHSSANEALLQQAKRIMWRELVQAFGPEAKKVFSVRAFYNEDPQGNTLWVDVKFAEVPISWETLILLDRSFVDQQVLVYEQRNFEFVRAGLLRGLGLPEESN
jgi:hypothetical protein